MKKLILTLALVFTFSTAFVSCRDTKNVDDTPDVIDDINDTMDDVQNQDMIDDDATDTLENTLQEGVNEIQENTGTGGTDDI